MGEHKNTRNNFIFPDLVYSRTFVVLMLFRLSLVADVPIYTKLSEVVLGLSNHLDHSKNTHSHTHTQTNKQTNKQTN